VKRLILARPAVEAGEKLGFLPGTYEAKVNPYLRPLYDALFDLVEPAQIRRFTENDVIEVAPLAYMRGRTLADSFIILDEAQNTTPGQMKMFLTRMGEGSRLVVTGDVTQIDLPEPVGSGLVHAMHVLRDVPGVAFCHFDRGDIVRNPVVQRIVDAYERHEGE
jgi:phosphate starvation-inducible PhoH-like protein